METYNGKIISGSYINLNSNYGKKQDTTKSVEDFSSILQGLSNNNQVKFSKHAQSRLNDRDLNLSNEQVDRLYDGVAKAKEKGLKESLVLVDNVALIVSIQNNTVITATDNKDSMVFTNIDGAVIV